MAEYKSAYTGPQIDAAIGAVAGKQDILVSGTNIKTINNTSLLGSGNIEIQGGGGGGEIYELDASDPTQWDSSTQKPTDVVIEEIATGNYQMVHVINLTLQEVLDYQLWLTAAASVDYDADNIHMRQFYRMDAGDEDEGDPPYIEVYTILMQPMEDSEDPTEMEYIFAVDEIVIPSGGGGGGDIYFENVTNPLSETRVALDLEAISAAIDEGKEVIISVNAYGGYPENRYFHMNSVLSSQQWFADVQKLLWVPQFACKTIDQEFSMNYDEYYNDEFIFNITEGGKYFTPTAVSVADKTITLDADDAIYIYNFKPQCISLNLDENSGEFWVKFNIVRVDDTQGSELRIYTSELIPTSINDSQKVQYTFVVYNESDNINTTIHSDYTPYYVANITLAQDYSKLYFNATDLYYLQHNEPAMIKCIWDDGQGHQGAFIMTLNTNQQGGTGNCPRNYSFSMVESGTFQTGTLKIDSGYTTVTGCPLEMYSPSV